MLGQEPRAIAEERGDYKVTILLGFRVYGFRGIRVTISVSIGVAIVTPRKLEHGIRMLSAGIPYTLS